MQIFDKGPLVRVESIPISHEAVFVAVFPCQNRRSRGAADRVRAERIEKNRTFSCELINVGCRGDLGQVSAVGRNGFDRMIVRKKEENVRAFLGKQG